MNYPNLFRIAALLATLGGGGVLAQTAPSQTAPHATPPVVSDVGPRPAEDRSSMGAVVLENSLVRAQRDNAFERAGSRTGVTSVGQGVLRATMRAQTEADLAQMRLNEALDLHGRGAASLNEK
jgi:hypothetical protein